MTVAQLIAAALAEAGVRFAFTVPGESFLGLLEALPEAGVRVIATRHEGGASFMAEAIGQLTGRPAAVMGTRAVGAGNMAIGIHTARANSTPMVTLLGQVETRNRGREAFQESDLTASPGTLAKWATEIADPDEAAARVGEGLRAMVSGRPGPVLFSLPEDILDSPVAGDARPDVAPTAPAPPDPTAVRAAIDVLATAERPLILAGGGVKRAGATAALVELAERLNVPVMAAWRRADVFPNDHRLYLGVTGYGAASTVRPRLEAADGLLVIGCRLNEIASFDYAIPGQATRWAQVDVEPRTAHAGLRAPDIAIAADAAEFLRSAVGVSASYDADTARNDADRAAYLAASVVDDGQSWNGAGVHPGKVIGGLQRVLPINTIVANDAGNFGLWLARGYRFRRPGTFLGATSGAMGYGLPAAIAASLADPARTAVALCGDGGLAMTMNELETAVREGATPVVICFDNRRYGTITMHQQRRGGPSVATDLGAIDFAAVAEACGALGFRVSATADFEPALRQALDARRPAVIQLEIDQAWVSPDQGPG